MEGSVNVIVEGRQRAGAGEEWARSRTRARGICRKLADGFAVIYEEKTEAGVVRTELGLHGGRLTVQRSGGIGLCLLLEPGQLREAPYETPYGTIPLEVLAKEVVTEFFPDALSARAAYTLFSGGEPVSENELILRITPN